MVWGIIGFIRLNILSMCFLVTYWRIYHRNRHLLLSCFGRRSTNRTLIRCVSSPRGTCAVLSETGKLPLGGQSDGNNNNGRCRMLIAIVHQLRRPFNVGPWKFRAGYFVVWNPGWSEDPFYPALRIPQHPNFMLPPSQFVASVRWRMSVRFKKNKVE